VWSFFLKPVVSDDSLDAAGADGKAVLAQLLSDDIGGGTGIEKAVADDLTDDLAGAAVVALRAALAIAQGDGTVLVELMAQLEIALLAEAILRSGSQRAKALAFALEKHGQFTGDLIIEAHGQAAGGTV
jgi:hypothetical protein